MDEDGIDYVIQAYYSFFRKVFKVNILNSVVSGGFVIF